MTAVRCHNKAGYTAPAAAKTIQIPDGTVIEPGGSLQPTVVVGDAMYLMWSGGAAPSSGTPAGWAEIASGLGGSAKLWFKLAQAGDIGAVVTCEPGAGASKVQLALLVLSSVDQVTPNPASNTASETVSQVTHTGPTLTDPVTGKVIQFYWSKEGTASSSRALSGAYTKQVDGTNGSPTNAQVAVAAVSNADVTGAIGAVTWTIDQPSANAFMVALAVGPVSTTVGVFPASDVNITGGTVVGAATAAAALGDLDDNTYIQYGVSGVAVHCIERFGSGGSPLQGPLQQFSLSIKMNGASSVVVTPTLRNGTTPINAQAPHTFVADGTFTWVVSAPDQAAQTNLADIEVDFAITGS